MQSTILVCASDDFQKSFKNFKNCVISKMCKISTISKSASVWYFSKSARPDCNHLHFKSIKNALKIICSPKQSIFAFFLPKNYGVKNSCRETLLTFYTLKITYLGIRFYFISSWSEKLSLKSDQLEVGSSVGGKNLQYHHDTWQESISP